MNERFEFTSDVLSLKQIMTGRFSAQILSIDYQLGKLEHEGAMTMIKLCHHSFLIHPILYFADNMTNTKDERATVKPWLLTSPESSKKRDKTQQKKKD